jgi:putative ABC transport system permease protein
MTAQILDIGPWQLFFAFCLISFTGAVSLACRLGLVRDLAVGTLRTFGQLFIMGYVLTLVFRLNALWPVILVFLLMIVMAVRIVRGRVGERSVSFGIPLYFSMLASYSLVAYLVTGVVVRADPWWLPQYFIPLAGMVVGNSMNALTIALERLFSDLRTRRDEVEMRLCLGADFREASAPMVRDALRAGMIPSINAMMGVGLVFIPGMMTGQILAGADPLVSIRYQIVVMLMLTASTTLSTFAAVLLVRKRCFGPGHNLVLPRGQ